MFLEALLKLKEQQRLAYEISLDHSDSIGIVFVKYKNFNVLQKIIDNNIYQFKVPYEDVYAGFDIIKGNIVVAFPSKCYRKALQKDALFPHLASMSTSSKINIEKDLGIYQIKHKYKHNFCSGSGDYANTISMLTSNLNLNEITPKLLSKVLMYLSFTKHYLQVQSTSTPHWELAKIEEKNINEVLENGVIDIKNLKDKVFNALDYSEISGLFKAVYTNISMGALFQKSNKELYNYIRDKVKNVIPKTLYKVLDSEGNYAIITKDVKNTNSNYATVYSVYTDNNLPIITFNNEPVIIKYADIKSEELKIIKEEDAYNEILRELTNLYINTVMPTRLEFFQLKYNLSHVNI